MQNGRNGGSEESKIDGAIVMGVSARRRKPIAYDVDVSEETK